MTAFVPSAAQLEAFKRVSAQRPLALFYQCNGGDGFRDALAQAAAPHGGRLKWAAREEQVLIGSQPRYDHACLLEFRTGAGVSAFVGSPAHNAALDGLAKVELTVLNAQPRAVGIMSALFARALPLWPFDNAEDPGEEPGVGTSGVMPSREAIAELKSHPDPASTVTMINWLQFRDQAAYYRYGKVALVTTHSIGAKLIYACRYRQVLIGNGGDPGLGRWHEFALMQYPGRAGFVRMTALRRYRAALHHREAGLTGQGQALTVSRPLDRFVWRR
jgi:uncharacterized protein (DUF1330 family)